LENLERVLKICKEANLSLSHEKCFMMFTEGMVVECVEEDYSDMMEDIDNIEKISHKDFVLLMPKVEIEIEVEAKVAAKNSNLVGVEDTFDC